MLIGLVSMFSFPLQEFIEYTSSNIPVFSSINSTLLSLDSELSYLDGNLQSVNSNLSSAVEEVSKQQGPPGLNGTQVCVFLQEMGGRSSLGQAL